MPPMAPSRPTRMVSTSRPSSFATRKVARLGPQGVAGIVNKLVGRRVFARKVRCDQCVVRLAQSPEQIVVGPAADLVCFGSPGIHGNLLRSPSRQYRLSRAACVHKWTDSGTPKMVVSFQKPRAFA